MCECKHDVARLIQALATIEETYGCYALAETRSLAADAIRQQHCREATRRWSEQTPLRATG